MIDQFKLIVAQFNFEPIISQVHHLDLYPKKVLSDLGKVTHRNPHG